jgi:hypothetical protein
MINSKRTSFGFFGIPSAMVLMTPMSLCSQKTRYLVVTQTNF